MRKYELVIGPKFPLQSSVYSVPNLMLVSQSRNWFEQNLNRIYEEFMPI